MSTLKQAVRAYCQHCLGLNYFNTEAIRDCQGDQAYIGHCPLFPYHMGKGCQSVYFALIVWNVDSEATRVEGNKQ